MIHKSTRLKYEPSPEPLHISAKQLSLNRPYLSKVNTSLSKVTIAAVRAPRSSDGCSLARISVRAIAPSTRETRYSGWGADLIRGDVFCRDDPRTTMCVSSTLARSRSRRLSSPRCTPPSPPQQHLSLTVSCEVQSASPRLLSASQPQPSTLMPEP